MFKNKKKSDSKVRWQSPRFKHRLQTARTYQRPKRSLPETNWEKLLAKIGLGSYLSRIASLLVFFLLIYLVFVPNFLFIKQIKITGADAAATAQVQTLVASYLGKNLPWPQKNLMLLSKNKLKNYLLENDQEILNVDQINKHLPSTLILSLTPRVDKYLIETASSTAYTVSSDGLVTNELIEGPSSSLPNLPILIKLNSAENFSVGQKGLLNIQTDYITELQNQLPAITGSPINYYETDNLSNSDLRVFNKNGLELLFDSTLDINKTLSQLRFLLSQFAPGDINRLYYVDMRFEDKSYVCYKNTACVAPISLPSSSAPSTTTPDNLSN